MYWRWWLAALAVAVLPLRAAELKFEAETVCEPQAAWLTDKDSPDHWNLWSKDKDADKKWSGGKVFRGPEVMKDRDKPEDGAPVLHARLTGIPKGRYDVELKTGRRLGVSLDGQTWKPYDGGALARNVAIDGTFELWVDDRYTTPGGPGSCYFDYILLRTAAEPVAVMNPGFETVQGGKPAGWTWWSREGVGAAEVVSDVRHGGERAIHLTHPGTKDFAFSNTARLKVTPGEGYLVHAWVKVANGELSLNTVAEGAGKLFQWDIGGDSQSGKSDWRELIGDVTVPEGVDTLYVRIVGAGPTEGWIDDVSLVPGKREKVHKPKIEGAAKTRVTEKLDRGVVAVPAAEGVHVSWRLLRGDAADVAFNVYRTVGGRAERLNAAPIADTTDLMDSAPVREGAATYTVRPVRGGQEGPVEGSVTLADGAPPYRVIKLQPGETVQKVGVGDLNGDGRYDYVLKTPQNNIDPYESYWQKSPDTYTLSAYLDDGTPLWRHDLGWAIERGIWYSPFVVYDLNGDGKAEVAAKLGEGDPRDPDGRVRTGPEWVVVWDGLTGKELARAPWPDRVGFGEGLSGYNLQSRNQLAVGYLDGKTPCLLTLRGTYSTMKANAFTLEGNTLRPLWTYTDKEGGRSYRGQGAHFTHCVDVDGDGRDEVILGSAVLDDNGEPLWSTGRGHNDGGYVGDLDPHHPGLEMGYIMETGGPKNGLAMVDVATGKYVWGLDVPSGHVHGTGVCTDIDPTSPGVELYGQESVGDHKASGNHWLFAANGKLLSKELDLGFALTTIYWDADLQREVFGGHFINDFGGGRIAGPIDGSIALIADVLGDWREEVITSVPGELRIYSTPLAATDRRTCLMQDPIYRLDTVMNAQAYTQAASTTECFEATAPGLNLTALEQDGQQAVRVVVSAPLDKPVKGTLKLTAEGATVNPAETAIDVKPGERTIVVATFGGDRELAANTAVRATLTGEGRSLRGQVPVRLPDRPLAGVPMVQAEAYDGEGGGTVQKRTDKVGVVGGAISHWDTQGHWLSWTIELPKAGAYRLAIRYSAAENAQRSLSVDGADQGRLSFGSTGGFGAKASEWSHATLTGGDGKARLLKLEAGKHVLRLENVDAKGLNLDYLALVPAG